MTFSWTPSTTRPCLSKLGKKYRWSTKHVKETNLSINQGKACQLCLVWRRQVEKPDCLPTSEQKQVNIPELNHTNCCGVRKNGLERKLTFRFNKIFGGFIMRQAFELGWANAHVFGNFHHLDIKDQYPLDTKVHDISVKANAVPGVCIWTTSGSELPLRSAPCFTSTPRSAMFK